MCLDTGIYLSINILSSPKLLFASRLADSIESFRSFDEVTTLIPFPPPPAAALIRRG